MAQFGWFGEQEHRVFNYKPIYYDPEKEEGGEKGSHATGSYIQGAFRNGNYARRRGATRAQSLIGVVGLLLVLAVLMMIARFYSLL